MPAQALDRAAASAGVQRYIGAVIIGVAVLTGLCLFMGVRGLAPVLGLAGFLCLPFARPRRQDAIGIGLLVALLAWSVVSVAWSPAPNLHVLSNAKDFQHFTALHMALQLLLSGSFVLACARLDAQASERALLCLGLGLLAGVALLAVEIVSRAGLYQAMMSAYGHPIRPDLAVRNLAQGGYVVAAMVWPAGLTLRRRGWPAATLALAAFVPASTFLFRGDAPTVALVASAGVFLAVRAGGRIAVLIFGGFAALYTLAMPWLMLAANRTGLFAAMLGHLPASWNARVRIWTFATNALLDRPLRGLGLDASRTFIGHIPLHPHDAALQLWLELGLPGSLIGAAFWFWLAWRIAENAAEQRLFAAVACATVTIYLVIGAISFGLWQEWWICAGALSWGACLLARRMLSQDASTQMFGVLEPIAVAAR